MTGERKAATAYKAIGTASTRFDSAENVTTEVRSVTTTSTVSGARRRNSSAIAVPAMVATCHGVTSASPVATSDASVATTISVNTTETATSTSHGRDRRNRRTRGVGGVAAAGDPPAAGLAARPVEGPRSSITRLVS